MNPSDPLADLYAQIFKMVESEPRFKIEAHRTSKAALSQAMLAKPYKGILPESFACEPKIDGVRVIVEVCRETHLVVFKTRNGNPLPAIQHFEGVFSALATVHGVFTFDCEAVSGSDFFDGVGAIRSQHRDDDARLWLLDLPDDVGTYSERRELMAKFLLPVGLVTLVPSFSNLSPNDAFRRFVSQGFEGAMVKDTTAPYSQGKRSNAWLKVKAVDSGTAPSSPCMRARAVSLAPWATWSSSTAPASSASAVASPTSSAVRSGSSATASSAPGWKCPSRT